MSKVITQPAWEESQGWRILDSEGHVVAAGPPIELEMAVTLFGFEDDKLWPQFLEVWFQ